MMRLFLMLMFCGCVYAQGKKQADAAEAKVKAGDYKGAIALYSDAIKAEPKNAKYYNSRALAFFMDQQLDKAHDDYSTAVKLDPETPAYLYDRAIFYFTLNYLTEAKMDHDIAVQKTKDDKGLQNRLLALNADISRNKGDFEDAIRDYKTVLQNNPDDGLNFACLTNLGAVLGRLNRNEEAISYLELAVKTYPKVASVYNNLGFRYIAIKEYAKALELYDKAISLVPKKPKETGKSSDKAPAQDNVSESLLYNNRGYAKLMLGDESGALQDVNQAIALSPDNSYAFRNRALIYNAQNKADLACADAKKALDLGFAKSYGNEMDNLKKLICKP